MTHSISDFLYYPKARSKEDIVQILARISWFFAFSSEEEFLIIAYKALLKDFSFQTTDDLDPVIIKLFERVVSIIHVFLPEEIRTIDPDAFSVTDVLVWDASESSN